MVPVGVHGPGGGWCVPGLGGGRCMVPADCMVPGGVHGPRGPPVNRMTNRCKNITLHQTSFAGGNYGSYSM